MIGDFIFLFLILGGVLLFLFIKSAQKDRDLAAQLEMKVRKEQEEAREEARKYQNGVRLVCLGCETHFRGPLTDTGCPNCHLLSLIVVENRVNEPKQNQE